MIQQVREWAAFSHVFLRYALYRVKLSRKVSFEEYPDETIAVMGRILQWDRRLRVEGAEHCPRTHPAVFACNHVRLNDPMYVWPAIYRASGEKLISGFMMRNDFFGGPPWTWLPVDLNELCELVGAALISRHRFQLSQMKPLLERLGRPGSFMMFPGGTRTRSGLAMEYHGQWGEPGAVSFFLVHAQRRWGAPVAGVPVFRTPNYATGRGVVTFGPPQYIDDTANRRAQREFDAEMALRIGQLVEVNALHVVGGILYLRALHGLPDRLSLEELRGAIEKLAADPRGTRIDPALRDDPAQEITAALRYYRRRGMLSWRKGHIVVNREAILSCPALTTRYRHRNPVKFFVNQVLHLGTFVQRLEELTL